MPPRRARKPKKSEEVELNFDQPPTIEIKSEVPTVEIKSEVPTVEIKSEVPTVEVKSVTPTSEVPMGEVKSVTPTSEVPTVEVKSEVTPMDVQLNQQLSDMRMMLQMRQTIDEQTAMMQKMADQLQTLRTQEETPEVDMEWPHNDECTEDEPEYDVVTSTRREARDRSYSEMYASDNDTFSKNITLTDASSGRWGSMPQTQTRVGMRTRGLCLNPTLQQPSIGGLM